MGQKTHPTGFRVGIIRPWSSTWFAKIKDYAEFVAEDAKIRKFIKKKLYAAGVASVKDIDVAMQLGANHPMGPLALGDYIGLDIVLAIMEVIYAETGDSKYAPSPLLRKMVRAGKLGKKTGVGFYDYSK